MKTHSKSRLLLTTTTVSLALSPMLAPAVTLISDDFTSGSIANHTRFRVDRLDQWGKKNNAAPQSLWTIGGGTLSNAGTTAGVAAEGGVGQTILVSDKTTDASLTQITVSFDYTVGTGSTLWFHLRGHTTNGSPSATEQLGNTGAQNGSIQNQGETDFGDMSLLDGTDPGNGTGGTASFTAGTSGTYSMTFDLTSYAWHADEGPGLTGSISNVTDFDYILAAFGSNVTDNTGAGTITIDNFSVEATAVPEPSTFALLGLGGLALILRRRV